MQRDRFGVGAAWGLLRLAFACLFSTAAASGQHSATAQVTITINPNYNRCLELNGTGTIPSPVGSDTQHPSWTGTAQISFDLEYGGASHNGPIVGSTVFKSKYLNFQMTAGTVLNMLTHYAQAGGIGTLNGQFGYSFSAIVLDNGDPPKHGTSPDFVRFRIWRTADGFVMYDNMVGAQPSAPPGPATSPVSGDFHIHVS